MEYLYHYTSVDSLKSILSNKTIRLHPLTEMDDLQEAQSKDSAGFAKYVFCSSWSEKEQEDIPMWIKYGDNYCGVRIALPPLPFKRYYYTAEEVSGYLSNPDNTTMLTNIPLEDVVKKAYTVTPYSKDLLLKKITYTDDQSRLVPSLWSNIDGNIHLKYGEFGRYKNTHWEFQDEYRYILYVIPVPISLITSTIESTNLLLPILERMRDGEYELPFDHYDLHISDEALQKMQIILGPKMCTYEKTELIAFCNQISPAIHVYESALTGTIR